MFYSCYAPVDYDCENCHELYYEECLSLYFQAGLLHNTLYFIHIIDKFFNHYVQEATTDADGTIVINSNGLPGNFFNKYAGEIDVKLSTTLTGSFVDLVINGITKQCITLTIIAAAQTEEFSNDQSFLLDTSERFVANSALLARANTFMSGASAKASIGVWIKRTALNTGIRRIFTAVTSSPNNMLLYFFTDGKIYAIVDDFLTSGVLSGGTALAYTSLTDWYFIVMTYDVSVGYLKLYVNGQDANIVISNTSIVSPGTIATLQVNGSSTSNIDNKYQNVVAVWDRPLLSLEVLKLYNNGAPLDFRESSGSDNLKMYFVPKYNTSYAAGVWTWENLIDNTEKLTSVNMEQSDLQNTSP